MSTLSAADGIPISAATSWFDASRFGEIASLYAKTGSITASRRPPKKTGVSVPADMVHYGVTKAAMIPA